MCVGAEATQIMNIFSSWSVNMHGNNNDYCECCDGPAQDCQCDAGCSCGCKGGMNEVTYTFDKFMDNIIISESKKKPAGDSPIRERAKRHQERPLNRIRFGGGK